MKPSRSNPLFARFVGAGIASLIVVSGHSAEIPYKSTATSTTDGGLNTNWQGDVLPGPGDVAAWTTAGGGGESRGGTINFPSPVSWLGVRHEDSGGALTLTGSEITLGASGITEVRWEFFNINNNVTLGADQTWAIGNTTTLTGALGGSFNLTKTGNSALNLNGVNTGYTGTLTHNAGTLNTGAFGGSITVAGGTANLTGALSGALTLNGGTANLSADVAGIATIAGGVLNLNSGASLTAPTVSGGTLNVNAGSTITGDVDTQGTTTLNLAGSVSGLVKLYVGDTLGLRGGTIGSSLTLGESDFDSGTINFTSPVSITGDLTVSGTQNVNILALSAPGVPVTLLNYTGTASDPNDADPENNFVIANSANYRTTDVTVGSGAVTVALGGESHKWVGSDPTNPTFWDTAALNWNSTDSKFFAGDAVTFDETATGKTVVLQSLLAPHSVTFNNTSAYSVTGAVGTGLTGSMSLTKSGTGTLLLGGPASNFTGAVAINGGVLNLNNGEALGNNSGVTIAAGARLNFNGHSPSAVGKAYSFTIAGDGGDGTGGVGAILTTGADIYASAGIRDLTLSANAEIGGNNGRFDVGLAASGNQYGTINGGGFTLTKVGTNAMVFRGPASNITYVVNAGRLTFEDFNTASGTNPITVNNSGSSLGTYGTRNISNNVTLNTGTTLINVGGGEGTWSGAITAATGTTINTESGNMTLSGTSTAAGTITKSGGSQLTFTGNFTNGLVFNQNAGTVQIGNVGTGGNFLGGGTVNVGAGLLFRNRLSGANNTITSNFTFASSSSELRQHAGGATDTLTLTGTIGNSTANGILQPQFGRIVLASGANATVNTVPMLGGVTTPGTLEVQTGASVTTLYFNIGNGSNNSGRLNITGGTATVLPGSAGTRIGHWDNGNGVNGSELNVSAGIYDASATGVTTSVGWDGLGTMTVGGGASSATAKTWALSLDSNGNSSYNDTLTLSSNGVLEIGAGGAFGASANDYIILNGGTMTGVSNSTWSARLDAAQPSTLSANFGVNATITGAVTGSAALAKAGAGTVTFNNASIAYNGILTTTEGTTQLSANLTAPDLVASGTGTVSLGSSTAGDVIVNAGGTVKTGSAAAVGSATAGTLTLDGGTASFRVGTTKDLLTVPVVSVNSPSFISIVPTNALTAPSSFPILKYTGSIGGTSGFAGLSLASSNPHYSATLVDDVPNEQLVVNITAADSVVWKGSIDGNWNVDATENWVLGSSPTTPSKYYDFDVVKFDDTGITSNNVTLVGTIRPATLAVENTTGTYTFQGSGISGGTGLVKTGAGNLTLLSDNTYSGPVSITGGGTVTVGSGGTVGALGGSGSITLSNSSLVLNRSDAQTLNRSIIGTGGTLIKNGGNLTMSSGNNTCDIVVNSGTLFARGGDWAVSFAGNRTITVNTGGTLDTTTHALGGLGGATRPGNIVLGEDAVWKLNNEQQLPNTALTLTAGIVNGPGDVRGTGTIVTLAHGTKSSQLNCPINSGNGPVTFNVADGAVAIDLLASGAIFGGNGYTKSGPGKMVATGANTSTGVLTVSAGILEIGAGGTTGTLGTGAVTNNATLAFNRSDALAVPNLISGTGSVVKNGAGVTTLNAINTYSGNTTVNAGTLSLADNAGLRFVIGANGVNNKVTGTGSAEFLGDFTIDLTGATVANGNSWNLVDTTTLTEVFVSSFTVVGFSEDTPGVHTRQEGPNLWTFTEADGTLTVQIQGYSAWATQITNPDDRDRGDDPDGDGFTNIQEFLFGTSPIASTGSLVTMTTSGSNLVLRWLQRETASTYLLKESSTLDSGSWITSGVVPALDDQTGVATDYDRWIATIPLGSGSKFFRVEGTEN